MVLAVGPFCLSGERLDHPPSCRYRPPPPQSRAPTRCRCPRQKQVLPRQSPPRCRGATLSSSLIVLVNAYRTLGFDLLFLAFFCSRR